MEKSCTRCNQIKDLSCFYRDNKISDKLNIYCKDCFRELSKNYLKTVKGRYSLYKKDAKRRHLKFTITFEQFNSLWNKNCYYCGDKINGIGLDRVDNEKGYEFLNVKPCCSTCNYAKRFMTTEQFVQHCLKVINNLYSLMA